MRFPYRVKVPECWAPFKGLSQYLDGDQPLFDKTVFEAVMADLGFTAGNYQTVAGYDNKLYVKFRTAEDAAKFGKAGGIA